MGNFVLRFAGASEVEIVRDRSQFIVSGDRAVLEPFGLWRAFDDVAQFSSALGPMLDSTSVRS
jgi:hypothetical protein